MLPSSESKKTIYIKIRMKSPKIPNTLEKIPVNAEVIEPSIKRFLILRDSFNFCTSSSERFKFPIIDVIRTLNFCSYLGRSAENVFILVTTKRLVRFDIRIIMRITKIIAAKPGIFLLLKKLYSGSNINVNINAIKKGIKIVLSSLRTTNEKTIIAIEARMPSALL
jgi:hypothetical protein